MNIRYPVRAGSFYEATAATCRHQARKIIDAVQLPDNLPGRLFGGLVPHAGWEYSGKLAAMTLLALARAEEPRTIVLLGADHTGAAVKGEVFDSGVWQTPLGEVAVDEPLAAAILSQGKLLRSNPQAHAYEHSLEVQVPLIEMIAPGAMIVPIAVPPLEDAAEIGRAVGRAIVQRPGVVVVGSTDLTHHAGHFPSPGGRGLQGVQWTIRNDRRMLELIEAMNAESIVAEAAERGNACGAGAVAATVAACQTLGAARGMVLDYTNSYDVVHAIYPDDTDDTTVGYASVVFA